MNKFSNSLTELQESVGSALLPFRNFSLSTLATGIDLLTSSLGTLQRILIGVIAYLSKPIWVMFGSYIKQLYLQVILLGSQGFTGLAVGLAKAQVAAIKLQQVFAFFGKQMVIFGGIALAIEGIQYAFSDASGEIGKQIDQQRKSLEAYKRTIEGLRGSQATAPGGNPELMTLGELVDTITVKKELDDTLKAIESFKSETDQIINNSASAIVQSSIEQVNIIDSVLQDIRMQRRGILANDPENTTELKRLQELEGKILADRQRVLTPKAASQQLLDSEIESLRARIDRLNTFKRESILDEAQIKRVNENIATLEGQLDKAAKAQDRLRKATKDSLTELQRFTREMRDLQATFNDDISDIERGAQIARTRMFGIEALAGATPGQTDFTNNLKTQEELSSKIARNLREIQSRTSMLTIQGLPQVLASTGLNYESGTDAVRAQQERALDGTPEKQILTEFLGVKELQSQTRQMQEQLEQQRSATTRQVFDSNQSLADWLQGIERQSQELRITAQQVSRDLESLQLKQKLRESLQGFKDTFVTQFIDSFISIIDSLQEPLREINQVQIQMLQNVNQAQDTIRQGQQLQRNLPQPFTGGNGYQGGLFDFQTEASFYGKGDGFAGRKTSTGEIFNPNAMTASINQALREQLGIKFGDQLEVHYKGRVTKVRINDHGPYDPKEVARGRLTPHASRGIDLSYAAAKALGIDAAGVDKVQFRVVGRTPPIANSSALVQKLRQPVTFGASPAQFDTNTPQQALNAGTAQAVNNLQTQNQNASIILTQGRREESLQNAQLQLQRSLMQLREANRELINQDRERSRQREDLLQEIGPQTPMREFQKLIRDQERRFEDMDIANKKSEEDLVAAISQAQSFIQRLNEVAPQLGALGIDVAATIASMNDTVVRSQAALSNLRELQATNDQVLVDIKRDQEYKLQLAEETRAQAAETELRNLNLETDRQAVQRATFLAERALPGDYSQGDPIQLELDARIREITGQAQDEIANITRSLATGEAYSRFGSGAADVMSAMVMGIEVRRNNAIAIANEEAARQTNDRVLTDREAQLNVAAKMAQSQLDIRNAVSSGYGLFGIDTKGFQKQQAQQQAALDFERGKLEIDQLANSGKYTTEQISELNDGLVQLNDIRLKNIRDEFGMFSDVIRGVKGDLEGVFRDFILGTKGLGESLTSVFQSILNNLASMASKMLSDQLFGAIFSKNVPVSGRTPDFVGGRGGSNFLGTIGGLVGGLFGGGSSVQNVDALSMLSGVPTIDAGSIIDMVGGDQIYEFAEGGMVGNLARGLRRERAISGYRPHVIIANEGERVLNPEETKLWNKIMYGNQLSGYSSGGMVGGGSIGTINNLNTGGNVSVPVSVSVNTSDSGGVNVSRLERVIESKIQQVIREERRPGGAIGRGGLYDR